MKREISGSSVVESSEEPTRARRPNKKYCILYDKCSNYTDNYKDRRAMVSKHKQKKQVKLQELRKDQQRAQCSYQEKFQKFVINKKRRKTEKELQHFQEMQISDDESDKSSSAWQKAWKVEISHPSALNEI